jgi:ribokinase
MKRLEVVGMGAMNLDHLYRVERILVDGEAPVKEMSSHPGGSAANTVYGLAKLGVSTGFVGAVGDDEAGKRLSEDLAGCGVDVSQIAIRSGAGTGSTLCLSDEQGRRSLYVMPGANSLLEETDVDPEYLNKAQIVHLSSFVHDSQFELQKRLVARLDPAVKVSFAPGSIYAAKGIDHLTPLLERTHSLFVNRDEMRQLTGEDFAAGARTCLERGCRTVVTTLGNIRMSLTGKQREAVLAAHVLSQEGEHFIESKAKPGTPPVDTTGAGDAFAAGFLYGFLKGKKTQECGLLAEITARSSIARAGAREGMPSLAELSEEYRTTDGQTL